VKTTNSVPVTSRNSAPMIRARRSAPVKASVPAVPVPLEPVPEVAALVLAAGLLLPLEVELHRLGVVAHGSLEPDGLLVVPPGGLLVAPGGLLVAPGGLLVAPGGLLPPGRVVTVVVPG
jgi:hypothetical protein